MEPALEWAGMPVSEAKAATAWTTGAASMPLMLMEGPAAAVAEAPEAFSTAESGLLDSLGNDAQIAARNEEAFGFSNARSALRSYVMSNIAESQAASASSNIDVLFAKEVSVPSNAVGTSELGNALSGLGANPLGRNINSLEEFGSGAGFSGVYDVQSGKWLAYPSGETRLLNGNTPLNLVPQYQGHVQVNQALSELLGYTSDNRLGYSMLLDDEGNFQMGWNSNTVNTPNPNFPGRTVPESMRQQVLDAIMQTTGRKAYTP